jgi:hypothetical protein
MPTMMHVAWIVCALAVAAPQPEADGRVVGHVVVSGSSTPIVGATVTLTPPGHFPMPRQMDPSPPPQAITSEDGNFSFDHLVPGTYRVSVRKDGFASRPGAPFGAPPPSVTVAAGHTLDLGVLSLSEGGVITGRVLDETGAPLANAHVRALRRVPPRDDRPPNPPMLPIGRPASTDDRGEFRLFGLAAGEYLIEAIPPTASPMVAVQSPATRATATFFPSTTDVDHATAVTIADNGVLSGIEIRIATARVYVVSGFVVDSDGKGIPGAMVQLIPSQPGRGTGGGTRSGRDGRFAITGVTSGAYHATATVPTTTTDNGRIVSTFSVGPVDGTTITVGDADVTDVRVAVPRR